MNINNQSHPSNYPPQFSNNPPPENTNNSPHIPLHSSDRTPDENLTTPEKRAQRSNLTQFILNILYGSLIIAAFIGIAAIVFGNDEYGSKAAGTVFLLIVVDGILLLALLPKNTLFRYSMWGLSILAFAFTTLGIWLPKNPVMYSDIYPYEKVLSERTIGSICQGIGVGFWLLLATVVLLSFVSLAEPLIEKTGKRAIGFYYALIIIAITGTLPIAIAFPVTIHTGTNPDIPLKIYASTFILSLTIVLILGIAIIARIILEAKAKSNNKMNPYMSRTAQAQSQQQGSLQEWQNQGSSNNLQGQGFNQGQQPPSMPDYSASPYVQQSEVNRANKIQPSRPASTEQNENPNNPR